MLLKVNLKLFAGFHVEYGGMAFSVFFMAEYANMIIIAVSDIRHVFLGGWLSPFQGVPLLDSIPVHGPVLIAPSIFWLLGKDLILPVYVFMVTCDFPTLSL